MTQAPRPTKRRKTRQREAFDGAIDVRCECGKRLASMWLDNHGQPDGVEFVTFERAMAPTGVARDGIRNLARQNWRRVACPKCGRDWRGDIAATLAATSERVTLSNRSS